MSSINDRSQQRSYWRSLDDLADTAEFRELVSREFPSVLPEAMSAESRRGFLKLMGASLALAGMAACRWPRETILPFARRPEGRIPGEPVEYATALDLGGNAQGLLVTSYDGRPIKVDGNPSHAVSAGKSDAWGQASILELFDPDRSRVLVRRDGAEPIQPGWAAFEEAVAGWRESWAANGGAGLRILSPAVGSPSLRRLRAEILADLPQAAWYEYEPISLDDERRGLEMAYGRRLRPQLALDRAAVVVTLDAELLGEHPSALRNARGLAAGRRTADDGRMSRIVSVESRYTLTGAMADHRYARASSAIPSIAAGLAARLGRRLGASGALASAAETIEASGSAGDLDFLDFVAEQLVENRGHAVIAAGAHQPAEVHALVAFMNDAIGAVGKTLTYTPDPDPGRPHHRQALQRLAEEVKSGGVETLFVLGGNPAYHTAADVDVEGMLESVPTTVHLGTHQDETAALCTWHLPMAHDLESWGDASAWDGTVSVVQPMIQPLHGGRSALEVLGVLAGREPVKAYDIVRETARGYLGGGSGFEASWREALRAGVIDGTASERVEPGRIDARGLASELAAFAPPKAPAEGELELVVLPDRKVRDGRFANNGWLQELPDPITKLTWGNAVEIGLTTAGELGVETGDVIELSFGERSAEAPVFVNPGQAPRSLAITTGYGRRAAGSVGTGVGVDVYSLVEGAPIGAHLGVTVERTGRKEMVAHTQNHFAIDDLGRKETEKRAEELLRDVPLEEYRKHPDAIQHIGHAPKKLFSLWKEWEYEGHAWAMAIDLNVCTGCSACVVACQSENNIPIVGKEQVHNGREMHWIRVDRYYKGPPEEPQVGFQPVACQHCENAPCEQVCPVAATVHDDEGLNVMVYNRCVGTRYCSNNCPYKVRRFNFFNYNKQDTELEAVRRNPEVTVRARGVMEKCTFCTQRIEKAKIRAKNEERPVADGEIVPACAQACPTDAIVFGDLNDPASRVRKLHEHQRSYALLAGLNARPRNHYLGKIRNPAGGSGHHESGSGEHA
jgi:molybdopterin-containing oxidoreductase family iron-sulfur binding subunit